MIEPKPLSKEWREEILHLMADKKPETHPFSYEHAVRLLLSAEQYWRQAIRNSVWVYGGGGTTYCGYCGGSVAHNFESAEPMTGHKPDCAWVRAHE